MTYCGWYAIKSNQTSFPGSLWLGVVVPVGAPFMSQIESFNPFIYLKPLNCVQISDWCWIVGIP